MAAEVLRNRTSDSDDMSPFRHAVHHDLESFIWVLLYLAVSTPGYESAKTYFAESLATHSTNLANLAAHKHIFWSNSFRGWSGMGDQLNLHPIWPTIDAMRTALREFRAKKDITRHTYHELYDHLVQLLEDKDTMATAGSHKRPLKDASESVSKRVRTAVAMFSPKNLRKRTHTSSYNELSGSGSSPEEQLLEDKDTMATAGSHKRPLKGASEGVSKRVRTASATFSSKKLRKQTHKPNYRD
jgi:hypothetical protein